MLHNVRMLKKNLTLSQLVGLIILSLVLLGLGFSLLLIRQQQDLRQQASTLTRCTEDARICADGSAVGRDPQNNCQFFPCRVPQAPGTNTNTTDPDNINSGLAGTTGSTYLEYRCPTNNQGEITCLQQDPVICESGQTWVPDDSRDLCGCYDGGSCIGETTNQQLTVCTLDAKECPDGSFVGRDASNDCAFSACPTVSPSPSPTATTTSGSNCSVCPQVDPIVCGQGQTAIYNSIADSCGCVSGGSCVDTDLANNCEYQQVQCVTTPCEPQLICTTPTSETPTADLNSDNRIDVNDYIVLARNFFKTGKNLAGDINHDGEVNLLDFVILRRQFSLL